MRTAPSFIAASIVSHSGTQLPSISRMRSPRRDAERAQGVGDLVRRSQTARQRCRRSSSPSALTSHSAGWSRRQGVEVVERPVEAIETGQRNSVVAAAASARSARSRSRAATNAWTSVPLDTAIVSALQRYGALPSHARSRAASAKTQGPEHCTLRNLLPASVTTSSPGELRPCSHDTPAPSKRLMGHDHGTFSEPRPRSRARLAVTAERFSPRCSYAIIDITCLDHGTLTPGALRLRGRSGRSSAPDSCPGRTREGTDSRGGTEALAQRRVVVEAKERRRETTKVARRNEESLDARGRRGTAGCRRASRRRVARTPSPRRRRCRTAPSSLARRRRPPPDTTQRPGRAAAVRVRQPGPPDPARRGGRGCGHRIAALRAYRRPDARWQRRRGGGRPRQVGCEFPCARPSWRRTGTLLVGLVGGTRWRPSTRGNIAARRHHVKSGSGHAFRREVIRQRVTGDHQVARVMIGEPVQARLNGGAEWAIVDAARWLMEHPDERNGRRSYHKPGSEKGGGDAIEDEDVGTDGVAAARSTHRRGQRSDREGRPGTRRTRSDSCGVAPTGRAADGTGSRRSSDPGRRASAERSSGCVSFTLLQPRSVPTACSEAVNGSARIGPRAGPRHRLRTGHSSDPDGAQPASPVGCIRRPDDRVPT